MADFLTEHRNALEKRLKELRPLYDEYLNLERVKDALQGVGGRRPGRPRGSTTRRRPGRPRGATTRRRSTNGRRSWLNADTDRNHHVRGRNSYRTDCLSRWKHRLGDFFFE